MASAIILLASQALALTAPTAMMPTPRGAQVSAAATATVEILHAETTREEPGPQALKRQRLTSADGRVSIAFE